MYEPAAADAPPSPPSSPRAPGAPTMSRAARAFAACKSGGSACVAWFVETFGDLDRRVVLAFVMVVVAILGAIAAYRSATLEQELSELTRRLAEGQLLAMAERQKLLDGTLANALVGKDQATYEAAGRAYAERAGKVRNTDARLATWLDFKAQEEFAAARAVRPFANVKGSAYYGDLSIEPSLQHHIAARLAAQGFAVDWEPPAVPGKKAEPPAKPPAADAEREFPAWESARIWQTLGAEIRTQRQRVPKIALCVVGFVLALVAFSCADLAKTRKRWWLLTGAGLATAAIVFSATLYIDPGLWLPYVLALVAAAIVFVGAGWLGLLAAPDEHGHPFHPAGFHVKHGFVGEHVQGGHAVDLFTRVVIGAVALAALASALAGYGFSRAEANAAEAAGRASAHALEFVTRSSRTGALANNLIASYADAAETRARRAVIGQWEGTLEMPGSDAMFAAESARADAISQRAAKDTRATADFEDDFYGQAADPRFPARLVLERPLLQRPDNNAWEPFALWDAERADVLVHHHVATAYLRSLTLFAIALYLFGQGFGMGKGRPAYLLVTCGVLFLAVGIVWGLRADAGHHSAEVTTAAAECALPGESKAKDDKAKSKDVDAAAPTVRERSARHFAIGEAIYQAARDSVDYRRAVPSLRCAVALRPDFGPGSRDLSTALQLAESPESGGSYVSLSDPKSIGNVLKARERAKSALAEQGFDVPVKLANSVAFASFMAALADKEPERLPQAERELSAAFARARAAPGMYDADDVAMIGFNVGLLQLARGNAKGAAETYAAARSGETRPGNEVVAGAMTDLETLAARCKAIAEPKRCESIRHDVDEMKRVALSSGKATEAQKRAQGAIGFQTSPAGVRVQVRLPAYQPQSDELTLMLYVWDPAWESWRALQDVSKRVPRETVRTRSDGVHEFAISMLDETGGLGCLQGGGYRAEVYVNGQVAASTKLVELTTRDFVGTRLPRLNLQLCRPANWKRAPIKNPDELLEAFGVTYERGGYDWTAFMFATHLPLSERVVAASERSSIQYTFNLLTGKRLIADPSLLLPYRGGDTCAAARPAGAWYWRSFLTSEGVRHLAVVSSNALPGRALCDLLDSVGNRYSPYLKTASR